MARLVEILALEMEEWPEGITHLTQSSVDREIYDARDGNKEDSVDSLNPRFDTRKSHTEDAYPIVTRAQWQAERDRQKGGEWREHRGSEQPVIDGTVIEYKLRNGDIGNWAPERLEWDHTGHAGDIMQYRIISQPQAEEVEVKDTTEMRIFDSAEALYAALNPVHEAKWHQSSGPLAWRDTIIHCQAVIEDCEREIQRNVDLLDAEGLYMQLNAKVGMAYGEPDVGMGDWQNWRVGDVVESNEESCGILVGDRYAITEGPCDEGYIKFIDRDDCDRERHVAEYKFIRRP